MKVQGEDVETQAIDAAECLICLESGLLEAASTNCKHSPVACRGCMEEHFRQALRQNAIPVRCPQHDCSVTMNRDEVEPRLSSEDFAKFTRLERLRETPDLRDCPKCGE